MAPWCWPAAAPRRASGCLSIASRSTGASPPMAACAASRANRPAGVSASGSPPESSTATCQRASAASTRRASSRSGVTRAAVLPAASSASRSAIAMASASSSALAASINESPASAASAWAAKAASPVRARHRSVAAAGRKASDANRSRPCGAGMPSVSTASRAMPMRVSSACMANCGWPATGIASWRSAKAWPAISAQDASSRLVSSPGSTTAPRGSLATAAISAAVAGMEPVEPATITGPRLCASRAASALSKASRRSVASLAPRSARIAGQAVRAILRNSSVSCQYRSRWSGTKSSRRSQDTPRVVMSSIRRARSSASASAAAGWPAISGASPGTCGTSPGPGQHQSASAGAAAAPARRALAADRAPRRRLRRRRRARTRCRPRRRPRSPTMRGRIAALARLTARNRSRASRQARRVGR